MFNRFKLEEGSAPLLLIWFMLLVAAFAIERADLMAGLNILPYVLTIAILTGFVLARSTFMDGTIHLMSIVYGLAAIVLLVGDADLPLRERILDLVNRQLDWVDKAVSDGTGRDGLIFVMHTSVVFWVLGYTAAWYTFRHPRVWRVVLPTGLVLLSVVYYYFGPEPLAVYLAIYFLLSMIYIARTYLIDQEKNWRADTIRFDTGIRFTFFRASMLIAVVALAVAFSLPALPASAAVGNAFSDVNTPWQRFQNEWTRMYSSLRSYGVETNDAYSSTLVLGGPRSVGNTVIMDVFVEEELPNVYWQGAVFDQYQDGRWQVVRGTRTLHYPDDGPINVPVSQMREEVDQLFVNYVPNAGTLYAAPEVIASDRQIFVEGGADASGRTLVSSVYSRFVLRQNEMYQMRSRISVADADSLRRASRSYPDWVRSSYLQLPDSITPQTLALAEELTAPYDNPFDKAIAVRNYLREAIAYNDQIQAPPPGVDPVHYVLFDSPEGYCNYYASAMVVMLRSQGIPARMVAGYAQGKFDPERKMYRVIASNAHTWVEVYFPVYGWIQFEPTAALPLDSRPEGGSGGDGFGGSENDGSLGGFRDAPAEIDDILIPPERDIPAEGGVETTVVEVEPALYVQFWYALGAIGMAAAAFATVRLADKYNRRVEMDVDRSYARLGSWAKWLHVRFRPVHTPYERAEMLAAAIPDGRQPILNLTREFVVRRFARQEQRIGHFNPLIEWKSLRPLLLRQTIYHYLPRRFRPKSRTDS
ncbi:MAG: transglutaminase-like domain-containing protein [Anaerolineae bacterium]|nr:transglutaminase-like domain-containing protein [Anaerolineae bacterium]